MGLRLQLHDLLKSVLGSDHVYFQPPASVVMQYPAIVYQWDSNDTQYGDNFAYRSTRRYQITHISRDPDTPIPDKLAQLKLCSYDRFFVAENLNHYVFTLYF